MSETTGSSQNEKSTKILRKPERTSVLIPTFAAARHPGNDLQHGPSSTTGSILQRQCSCGKHRPGGGQCRSCRQKNNASGDLQDEQNKFSSTAVQKKEAGSHHSDVRIAQGTNGHIVQPTLTVNEPDDAYEQEADRVADAVMRTPPATSPDATPATTANISRLPADSGAHANPGGDLSQAPAHVEAQINQMNGRGQPLLPDDQRFFEDRMGYDFSHVRLHTDSNAVQASRDIQAKAFTFGNNIAFNEGAYRPDTDDGRHLLAHELTHVVQQTGGAQLKRLAATTSSPGPARAPQANFSYMTGVTRADIQRNFIDDVAEMAEAAMETVSDVVEAVIDWIDLLGPKRELMNHMSDAGWIVDKVTKVENDNEANPKHDMSLTLSLYAIGARVGAETMAQLLRIQECNSLEEVDDLRESFDTWKAEREVSLLEELEAKVEEYREVERSWLRSFGNSSKTADPVHPNQSSQDVALKLQGGVPQSTVIVETRVNFTFNRTALAMQDNDGDGNPDVPAWTNEEQTHFTSRFQQQLNDIWSTGAGAVPPFRLTAPPDHLLKDDSPKWSDVTANMAARVTQDASNPHFNITVSKQAPNESNRAHVGDGDGQFYLRNADKGYMAGSGPDMNTRSGDQMTLAHEWYHMIGNADEYAEHSASQSANSANPADVQGRWSTCQQHFNDIINDPASTPEEVQQAQADLQALQTPWTDVDPSTPGFQAGIYALSGRTDIPRECWAVRGAWRPGEEGYQELQPGVMSQRGGTTISDSAEDAARLSDRGNQVRPYMREGIVEELQKMLQGAYDPEVSFDHNFQEMTPQQIAETLQTRIQNVLHDINNVGATQAPAGESAPGDDHEGHDH